MSSDINWGNVIVGFGGVFLLGVIGVVVHLYLGRQEARKRGQQDQGSTGSAHGPAS